jgi:glycosyltransferase involved in cell wall biosynthesis
MNKRLLLVSTLDSDQPFGAFTRPYYLGQYLTKYFDVFQLGLNCSAVDYAPSKSIGSRSLGSYIKAIQDSIDKFQPDIVYAQETLPGLAALISLTTKKRHNCSLALDFHTFSAYEYWSRLFSVDKPLNEFIQLIKTYIAQGTLIFSGNPIIAAGDATPKLIKQWYGFNHSNIHCIGNGITQDFLEADVTNTSDPFEKLRPAKVVVLVAPKTFQFPSNDMSVSMAIDVAKRLESHGSKVQFVVIGRDGKDIQQPLPSNIHFLGFLPSRKDFVTHLHHADIGFLPFPKQAVAGGARNKTLDYFASNKLVISTPEGLRGVEEFQNLKHLLVTGYAIDEVAEKVLDAALNLDKYQHLANAAHTLIRDKYSWSAKAKNVAQVLMSLQNSRFIDQTQISKLKKSEV